MNTQSFLLVFATVFVALDIVGMVPVYLGMTARMPREERNRVLDISIVVAFVVAVLFIFVGEKVFGYLGITLSDFKIAGGLVLLLISLADLVNQPESANRASGSTGVVPLAVPLITGPAVLATLILQAKTVGYPTTLSALLVNYILAWVVLRKSDLITRMIGRDGTVVISKIVALLLAAYAVAMIRDGVFESVRTFRLGG